MRYELKKPCTGLFPIPDPVFPIPDPVFLPYLFLASSLSSLVAVWTYEFFVYKKTEQLLVAQIIPPLISIVACYIFIPKYGIEGVAYVLTSLFYLSLILIIHSKTFKSKGYV